MLRWLIATAGAGFLKGEVSERLRQLGRRAGLMAAVALLWLVALGFALAALVTWLADSVGTIAACSIVAAAFAILALIIQVTLRLSRGPRREKAPVLDALPGAEELGGASPLGLMAILALLGFIFGRQTTRR
jgi:hypothetical protein